VTDLSPCTRHPAEANIIVRRRSQDRELKTPFKKPKHNTKQHSAATRTAVRQVKHPLEVVLHVPEIGRAAE
jgi:hypothetical protein